jgi:hypothetical protein
MHIIDADREAANRLRVILADISGFWHKPGDDSPLCLALAQHRIETENLFADKLRVIVSAPAQARHELDFGRTPRTAISPRHLAAAHGLSGLSEQLGE